MSSKIIDNTVISVGTETLTTRMKIIISEVPDLETLRMADALLYAVHKWKTEKIKKMRLDSVKRWCKLAKKKMTYGNAYLLNMMLIPKEKTKWWKKILSKTKN